MGEPKSMRKFFLIAASILTLVVAAITLVPVIYHEELEETARSRINQEIEALVFFSHFRTSAWEHFPNISLSLTDIAVASHEMAGDTLIKADEILFAIDPLDFVLHGEIGIESIYVKNPRITAWVGQDGKNNFTILKPDSVAGPDADSSTVLLHIHKVEIENATLSFEDATTHTKMFASPFDCKLNGAFLNNVFDLTAEVRAQQAALVLQDKLYFSNKNVTLKISSAIDRLTQAWEIRQSEISINDFLFNLEGILLFARSEVIGVDCRFSSSQTEFKNVLSLLSFFKEDWHGISTDGKVDFQGYAKGNYFQNADSIPTFDLTLNIENASLKLNTLPDAIEDINLNLHLQNRAGIVDSLMINIDSLHFRIHDHAVHGHAHLAGLKNSKVEANFLGTIHFDELMAAYPIPGLDLEGEIGFHIRALGNYTNTDLSFALPFIDADLEVTDGKVKYDTLPDSLSNVHLRFHFHGPQGDWENAEMIVEHLEMNMGNNPINIQGRWRGLVNPVIEGYCNAIIQLEDIHRVFPMNNMNMKGSLATDISVKGTYNKSKNLFPVIRASAEINNGYFKSAYYPTPMENINVKAGLSNTSGKPESTRLQLDRLTFTLDGDPFEVSGSIEDFENYKYDFRMNGLTDLGKLTRIYPIEGLQLTGVVQANVQASGRITDLEAGRYERTKAAGDIGFKNLLLSGNWLPQSIEIVKADFSLSPEAITLKELMGRSGHSDFKLNGELSNYFNFFKDDGGLVAGRLVLYSDTLDINDWKVWFHSDAYTSNASSASVIQLPSSIDFDFDSNLRFVRFEDMQISNLIGEIRLRDGVMTMKEAGFNSLNARFYIGGEYDSRNKQRPLFDFELKIEELDIQKAYKEMRLLRELASAAADAEGIFSIDYKIKGELDSTMSPKTNLLVGGGDIHIEDAKINGMKIFEQLSKKTKQEEMDNPHLRDFTIKTEIRNNKLYVKPFSVKVGRWQTYIEGVNDINGSINYLIKVELLSSKKLKIPFNVTGSYNDPKVSIGKGQKWPEEDAVND